MSKVPARVREYTLAGRTWFKVQTFGPHGWRDIFLSPFDDERSAELFIRREGYDLAQGVSE